MHQTELTSEEAKSQTMNANIEHLREEENIAPLSFH